MGSVGNRAYESAERRRRPEKYSDVDSHSTPITDEDRLQMTKGSGRYFQSSNAFDINEALRNAVAEGETLKESFKAMFGWDYATQLKTVDAMDRSMAPANKTFDAVRMGDSNYLDSVMQKALDAGSSIPKDVRARLNNAADGFAKFRQEDVAILKSAIVGGTIYENAYASTTYNTTLSDSAFKYRKVKISMQVTKGTKGLFSPTGKESEFVLSRTGGYDISDIRIIENGTRLEFIAKTRK